MLRLKKTGNPPRPDGSSMPTLLAILAFVLSLTVAVLYGCWWLIPLTLGLTLLVGLLYGSWQLAGMIPSGEGAAAWWAGARARMMRAAVIFAIVACLGVLAYCLWDRFAPTCVGGCLSQPSVLVVAKDYTALTTVMVKPEAPLSITVPPGHRVDYWPAGLKESWAEKGVDIVLTLTVEKETEVKYRTYLCTALTPCHMERPKMTGGK